VSQGANGRTRDNVVGHRCDADGLPRQTHLQRFFSASSAFARTMGGADLDGVETGGGFFGCFGFFASRLPRN
jgi:hypothetical protein